MSVGQKSGCGLAECLWLKVFHEVTVKLSPGVWPHMKAHLEVEELTSSFTHVVVSRSQLLNTELPHYMAPG